MMMIGIHTILEILMTIHQIDVVIWAATETLSHHLLALENTATRTLRMLIDRKNHLLLAWCGTYCTYTCIIIAYLPYSVYTDGNQYLSYGGETYA